MPPEFLPLTAPENVMVAVFFAAPAGAAAMVTSAIASPVAAVARRHRARRRTRDWRM